MNLLWILPDRKMTMFASIVAAAVFILAASVVLPEESRVAVLLFDMNSPHFRYPFTIQNFEHVFFFIGLGELFVRWRVAAREHGFLRMRLLPEDDQTVLTFGDLGPIRRRVAKMFDFEHGFLPSLIDMSILQFQSGRSVDQTVAVMSSNLELMEHRLDMRYGLVRYIAWLIPTLGFIGTVIGLGGSLASVPSSGDISVYQIAHSLAIGFDCTMVALVESAILVYLLHLAQHKEESALNYAGTYALRNLINRLYAGPGAGSASGHGAAG